MRLAFVVTIVFWGVLAGSSVFATEYSTWQNITVHAMNSAFALLEVLLSRIVPRWANIPILVLVLGGYIGVAYITHATQGFYSEYSAILESDECLVMPWPNSAYGFLNPTNGAGKLAGYIVGIPVAAIIILAIIKGVCWIRDKVFAGRRSRAQGDEYQLEEKPSV